MQSDVDGIIISRINEIEQRDEQQILAELAGETIEDFIYEVTTGKKRTVKLSWAGTREMARYRGNISLSDPMITDHDGYIRIVVRGTDLSRNFSVFGGCHQPYQQKVKTYDEDGNEIGTQLQDDPFYFQKALSKAQRNVLQSVIPADFTARMIDNFLIKAGKKPLKQKAGVQQVRPARLNNELPPPEPEEITNLSELERLAYNRWHIQPKEMYKQLGFNNRNECTTKPVDCYLLLKELYEGAVLKD